MHSTIAFVKIGLSILQKWILHTRFFHSWNLSANFLAVFILFVATGFGLFMDWLKFPAAVFVFVLTGWIVSLCLHEAAHALAAYWGGDRSVVAKGYLSLEPLAYADPLMSFALPMAYLVLGGIGLPGGSVQIDKSVLKNRHWDSFVSAAGPLTNFILLIILALPYMLGFAEEESLFWYGVAFLAALQASAVVLNLLPIPGLDGFGILRPYLPYGMQAQARQIAGMLGIVLLIIFTSQAASGAIWTAVFGFSDLFSIDRYDIYSGIENFRFWN